MHSGLQLKSCAHPEEAVCAQSNSVRADQCPEGLRADDDVLMQAHQLLRHHMRRCSCCCVPALVHCSLSGEARACTHMPTVSCCYLEMTKYYPQSSVYAQLIHWVWWLLRLGTWFSQLSNAPLTSETCWCFDRGRGFRKRPSLGITMSLQVLGFVGKYSIWVGNEILSLISKKAAESLEI